MADISILYDRSETDELGIRLTAEERGIELGYLPFHKIAVGFGNEGISYMSLGGDYTKTLEETEVVINRTQSKSRRIFAATILEAVDKKVVNPLTIEMSCQSKIRALLAFYKKGIGIPKTVYVPCNVKESKANGREMDYTSTVTDLIERQLGMGLVVLKPDAGTHGREVVLAEDHDILTEKLGDVGPSVTNPSGVVAQEFVPKWFYDLRIIVWREKGHPFSCAPTAMARGGLRDFRTNAHLGNMVFRVDLPGAVKRKATMCGEALSEGVDASVIALDAMPYIGDKRICDEKELKACFEDLKESFEAVKKAKADPKKKKDFRSYTRRVEDAYRSYMKTKAYGFIQGVIQESLDRAKDSVLFHEGNSCPEFWEQTRIVGDINVAELLLGAAESMLDN